MNCRLNRFIKFLFLMSILKRLIYYAVVPVLGVILLEVLIQRKQRKRISGNNKQEELSIITK